MPPPTTHSISATPIAIIGAGPAGLIAAEHLARAGASVTVFERMPTAGRKFLMAGRGGLNLTHSEPIPAFVARYGAASGRLASWIDAFQPGDLREWAAGLGEPTFVGSSGRVFPASRKASPLLRVWLVRLAVAGVQFRYRHHWLGWNEDARLEFRTPDGGTEIVNPAATLLALGGASWPRLGSDGGWVPLLAAHGVRVAPLRPANCGFEIAWTDHFRERFQGLPLKNIRLSCAGQAARGEAMITRYGIEGGAVYAQSSRLRDIISRDGSALVSIDLRPDLGLSDLAARLGQARRGQSMATLLRKALNLSPLETGLLREGHGLALATEASALARQIKSVPVTLTAPRPLDRAISTAGGVGFDAVDDRLMLTVLPGVFVAGEMLDWEAPTGGYLLQACFATGLAAARGIVEWIGLDEVSG